MKVLFLCKQRGTSSHYQSSVGLQNSAAFTARGIATLTGVNVYVSQVADADSIDAAVSQCRPDICIIEAVWVTPKKWRELLPLHPKTEFYVRLHSKTPFIAMEGNVLEWVREFVEISRSTDNFHLACNQHDMADDMLKVYGYGFEYLPNLYFPFHRPFPRKKSADHATAIHICCFGATRELKNQLQQAVAAIIFADEIGKKLYFHINSDKPEGRAGSEVLKSLHGLFTRHHKGHEIVAHPWMSHEELLKLMSVMDLGMAVSFSESFCIVVADMIYSSLPYVTSKDVWWVPWIFQCSTTDTADIVKGLHCAWDRREQPGESLHYLERYNHTAWEVWKKFTHLCRRRVET